MAAHILNGKATPEQETIHDIFTIGLSELEVGRENIELGKQQQRIPRKRHGARNQDRHKFFVKWLLDTFHVLLLNNSESSPTTTQQHVLDVAGGKGEVAARLCMCHRWNVVMVDPRPADIVHCFEALVLPKIPKKWQQRLEEQRSENLDFVKEQECPLR